MHRRLSLVVLLSIWILGAIPGSAVARSAEEIEAAIADADLRLAQAQGAIDTYEVLLDDAEVIFLPRGAGVVPVDMRQLPRILEWAELVLAANESEQQALLEDEIAETVMFMIQNGDVSALLLDAATSGNDATDAIDVALRAVSASHEELVAEAARLLSAREAIEAEIALYDAEIAAVFPPPWVQDGGIAAILERYGPWENEGGGLEGPGVDSINLLFRVTHEESLTTWVQEDCYRMEDGLSYCHALGEPWGTYVAVYEEVTGGLRRYEISSGEYCDLQVDRSEPLEGGWSGTYSCVEGPRFQVGLVGSMELLPSVLASIPEES